MEHALGAFLGAAVGDAVGAFLEFTSPKPADVDIAMTLPGGGCWDVGPGQFTDDTELALCLGHGLAGAAPSAGFPTKAVAAQYAWWFNRSHPFDIGATTRSAFEIKDCQGAFDETADHATAILENVRTSPACTHSLANGSTIRATPLAICAHCLSDDAIAACAMADAGLSHPRLPCQHANAAYVIAAASLIRLRGNAAAALAAAERWAVANASKEVLSWLEESKNDGAMEKYDANSQMGFVKHAFQLAFYHLRRGSSFSEGLRHTLLCGGDTDTNAAIVCGLLGSLHGAAGIPDQLHSKVESYVWSPDCPHGGDCVRPEQLCGSQLAPLAAQLYQRAMEDDSQTAAAAAPAAAAEQEGREAGAI